MLVLGKGDVSDLLRCEDDLYYVSAGIAESTGLEQRAVFVASMRPEHTPEWRDLIKPNTKTDGLPAYAIPAGNPRMNDVVIGVARQRTAGNILSSYWEKSTPFLEWHAVGDPEGVLAALKDVPYIGKRRVSGYGEITNWELAPSELDGICRYLNEPLRPIPVDRWTYGGDWIPVEAAWKAPNWEVRSYSTRNRFALALKELGQAVRTTYLLEWVMDESLRRTVHKGTTKVERHHKFAKHLAFGAGGHLRSNNPADQEKAIVYNELVTNAVALQNVVDQTQALHALKSQGINVRAADLAFLSPYATSKLKRFGDYPTDLQPKSMPTCTTLPL